MPKIKNPLFSFEAVRALGKYLTFRRRGRQTILEKTPIPQDAKSLPQLEWRHMYQKAVALWHALSANEKNEWESLARPKHMTGFAWFMSQCLRPNPGIYLPLQGGTMQGDIRMAGYSILDIPKPLEDLEAANKKYVDDAAAPADYPFKLKPAFKRYVVPGWYNYNKIPRLVVAGRIYYVPIFVEQTTTYTRITTSVNVASPGTADLRIFHWNNGVPDRLILSAGTVNTGTTGIKEIVISQELTRGYYFLAIRCTGTPTLDGMDVNYAISTPCSGYYSFGGRYSRYIILTVTAAYADPAPAPTGSDNPRSAMVQFKET